MDQRAGFNLANSDANRHVGTQPIHRSQSRQAKKLLNTVHHLRNNMHVALDAQCIGKARDGVEQGGGSGPIATRSTPHERTARAKTSD